MTTQGASSDAVNSFGSANPLAGKLAQILSMINGRGQFAPVPNASSAVSDGNAYNPAQASAAAPIQANNVVDTALPVNAFSTASTARGPATNYNYAIMSRR